MLDILHISEATIVRSTRTWDGSGRFLAGGINDENGLGEIPFVETSAG
jgi:hypothetical protein